MRLARCERGEALHSGREHCSKRYAAESRNGHNTPSGVLAHTLPPGPFFNYGFLPQRAFAAFAAIWERFFGLSLAALAAPPLKATHAGRRHGGSLIYWLLLSGLVDEFRLPESLKMSRRLDIRRHPLRKPLTATVYSLERLRCNGCGQVFTVEEAGRDRAGQVQMVEVAQSCETSCRLKVAQKLNGRFLLRCPDLEYSRGKLKNDQGQPNKENRARLRNGYR